MKVKKVVPVILSAIMAITMLASGQMALAKTPAAGTSQSVQVAVARPHLVNPDSATMLPKGGTRPAPGKVAPITPPSQPANVLYVDHNPSCSGHTPCYNSIAGALSAAASGDTVSVAAGTYTENLTVTVGINLGGAGVGQTIIEPAVSGPNCAGGSLCDTASNVILVQSSNVTIHDLTVEGDNPNLTSGVVRNGADLDARNGIITDHRLGVGYLNLVVYNTFVRDIYLRGMYASTSMGTFNFHDNTVTNVAGDGNSIAMFSFTGAGSFTHNTVSLANDGIVSNWSNGIQFLNNTITNSGSGVHTDNAGEFPNSTDLIQGNTVSVTNGLVGAYGVWAFAPYGPVNLNNNTVTGCAVGLAAAGQNAPVTVNFTNNTVNGQNLPGSTGAYLTTTEWQFGDSNSSATFTGNVINNSPAPFTIEQTTNKIATAVAHNNSMNGNGPVVNNLAGAVLQDFSSNWWGTNAPAGVAAAAGANVDYTPWLNVGTDTSVNPGFQGDLSYLNVAAASPQFGSTGRIQEAINGVTAGGTVKAWDGTYVEQLDITQPLTLNGVSQATTIIQSPATLATLFTTSDPNKPVVCACGPLSGNVTIQHLTIDGNGAGNNNYRFQGIAFYKAGGTVNDTSILHVRESPLSGNQHGVALYANNADSTARTLTVTNNVISDYQKNGMALSGAGLTVTVTNNTVTGAGSLSFQAQNGIQVGYAATGTIAHNTVSGNYCAQTGSCQANPTTDTGADGAAGILLYESGSNVTVTNNTLSGNQFGIWSVAAVSENINNNTISSPGVAGIMVWNADQWSGGNSAGTTGTINHNDVSGLSYGLILRNYASTPQINMTGHSNSFYGNSQFGAWTDSVAQVDLTNNWWGAPDGPGTGFAIRGSGDHIHGNINYAPYMSAPPAYAHLQPSGPINVTVGTTVTLSLLVNAGPQGSIVGQQSYLTFPTNLLQNVDNNGQLRNTVTHDLTYFGSELQNAVDNTSGQIAYASGTLNNPQTGDFSVAQITFAANAVGDATVHWEFSPPDRNSKIIDANSNVVSDPTLYQDYVIHIVQPAQLTGHVIWQARPAQPSTLQALPINLTLTLGNSTYNFNNLTTDPNGYFSVPMQNLPNGTYSWRVKGPQYLSTSGSVALNGTSASVEMGLQPVGDANDDNLVDVSDFGILYGTFGRYTDPRADFNGDLIVDISDFGWLRLNFGQIGNRPGKPAAKPAGGSAVLELRPQNGGPANGGTVHVGDLFTLELWVNAQPGTNVVGQQSYISFPANTLQLGNDKSANPVGGNGLVTADGAVLNTVLQNTICNASNACVFNGLKVPAGSLAFASGTLTGTPGTGAFRVGQVTVQATSVGTARLHWQFSPADPANRNTKIVSDSGETVSQPGQFVDYTVNVVPASK